MLLLYRGFCDHKLHALYHLHSTMLLLYHITVRSNQVHNCHLHSTMLLLYHLAFRVTVSFILIYIPLCFYFISKALNLSTSQNIFTFHYASTLSRFQHFLRWRHNNLHSTMLLLYPFLVGVSLLVFLHLHSTMLLLYRMSARVANTTGRYLHSTMLLLYPFHFWLLCHHCGFTFHYASTLSFPYSFIELTCYKFTFHYASTLSPLTKIQGCCTSNLHSTMLLLYRMMLLIR